MFVYALPFVPVMRRRSILGLGLPSSIVGLITNDHYQSIVSVRLSVGALLFEPSDLDFWHDARPCLG